MSEIKPPPMPPRTREILRVIYVFRQKYQHPQNTVEWWKRCCDEMTAISKHFENDAFCNDLLVACYTDIERELKGERTL